MCESKTFSHFDNLVILIATNPELPIVNKHGTTLNRSIVIKGHLATQIVTDSNDLDSRKIDPLTGRAPYASSADYGEPLKGEEISANIQTSNPPIMVFNEKGNLS